jgi:hypothetical protein
MSSFASHWSSLRLTPSIASISDDFHLYVQFMIPPGGGDSVDDFRSRSHLA